MLPDGPHTSSDLVVSILPVPLCVSTCVYACKYWDQVSPAEGQSAWEHATVLTHRGSRAALNTFNHQTMPPLQPCDDRIEGRMRIPKQAEWKTWEEKIFLVSRCIGIFLVKGGYVHSSALVCTHVGQILCVCERQRGMVSNREHVYCSQMWRGMWRVGMQWLLELSRPSFSPFLLPFVPILCLTLPKTPLFAALSRSISLHCVQVLLVIHCTQFSRMHVLHPVCLAQLIWCLVAILRAVLITEKSINYYFLV